METMSVDNIRGMRELGYVQTDLIRDMGNHIHYFGFSSDSQMLMVVDSRNGFSQTARTASFYNVTQKGQPILRRQLDFQEVRSVIPAPDAKCVALAANHGHTISLVRVEDGGLIRDIEYVTDYHIRDIAFADSGRVLIGYASSVREEKLMAWQVEDGACIYTNSLSKSMTGYKLFTSLYGGTFATPSEVIRYPLLWDVRTGANLGALDPGDRYFSPHKHRLYYSPDGRFLAGETASLIYDHSGVLVFVAGTRKVMTVLRDKAMPPTAYPAEIIAFSHDGSILAQKVDPGPRQEIWFWSVESSELLLRLVPEHHAIFRIAFSLNGQLFAIFNGVDNSISIWGVSSPEQLRWSVQVR